MSKSDSSTLKEKDDLKRKAGKQLDNTLKDENDRLKSQLNKLNKDNAELRSDVDRLRTSTLKEKDDLKRKAGKQLDNTLKDENDRLKCQLNKLNKDNAELRSDVDRLRTSTLKEKDDLKRKAGKQLDNTLKDENDRLKCQLNKLNKDNAELRSDVDRLRTSTLKEKDDLKRKAGKQLDNTLKDENDRLKCQLNKLNKDNAELRSDVDRLRTSTLKEKDDLKRKAGKQLDNTLKDENDRLKCQLNKLNKDNAELRSDVDRLRTSTLKEKDDKILYLEKEYHKIVVRLSKTIEEKEKISDAHQTTISELKRKYGKQLDKTLKDENDRLKSQLNKLNIDNAELHSDVDRLRTSLSKVAGEKLMEDNPFVTDLGDPNRPQKLAEKFNGLYDNSWTDAFEALTAKKKDEKSICVDLLKVLQECWTFCSELSNRQLTSLHHTLHFADIPFERNTGESMQDIPVQNSMVVHDARKSCARQFIPHLCQHYWEKMASKDIVKHYWEKIASKDIVKEDILKPYVEACVELCWYSVITCPPIDYIFTAEKLDDFRGYTKNGEEVDYVVWPAMYLHQFGPCLYRGVVQFKQGSQ